MHILCDSGRCATLRRFMSDHEGAPDPGESKSGSWPRAVDEPKSDVRASEVVRSSARYQAGDLVEGKYRLLHKLGQGGMGTVWRARNETLEFDVALKVISKVAEEEEDAESSPTGASRASSRPADRLLQEAKTAARLGHPAIVRIFDFGKTAAGDPFIVMELLDGCDLGAALAKKGRLSPVKAVRTLLPIAHALAMAHDKQIVHRDLKPENIFLANSDDGQVRPTLVDFGVAKFERQIGNRLTQTGALLGSPAYMSPEQARGDEVDSRADIWAFSVVLYECVTGRAPFEGKNYNALLFSIVSVEPDSTRAFSAGDDERWAILQRGFKKNPDERWQSLREMAVVLARWLKDRNVHEDITGASLNMSWLAQSGRASFSTVPPPRLDEASPAAWDVATDAGSPLPLADRLRRVPKHKLWAAGAATAALLLGGALALSLSGDAETPAAKHEPAPAVSPTVSGVPVETVEPPGPFPQPVAAPVPAQPPAIKTVEAVLARTPSPPAARPSAPAESTKALAVPKLPRRRLKAPKIEARKRTLKDPFAK